MWTLCIQSIALIPDWLGLRFRVRYIGNLVYPNIRLYKTYCELFLRDWNSRSGMCEFRYKSNWLYVQPTPWQTKNAGTCWDRIGDSIGRWPGPDWEVWTHLREYSSAAAKGRDVWAHLRECSAGDPKGRYLDGQSVRVHRPRVPRRQIQTAQKSFLDLLSVPFLVMTQLFSYVSYLPFLF